MKLFLAFRSLYFVRTITSLIVFLATHDLQVCVSKTKACESSADGILPIFGTPLGLCIYAFLRKHSELIIIQPNATFTNIFGY